MTSLCWSQSARVGWPRTLPPVRKGRGDIEACRCWGLLSNPKKGFENETKCKFWGVEVDGVSGLVRPSPNRLWPLIAICTRVIALGLSTVGLLKAISGSWTSILLLRRRALACLDVLFAAASSGEMEQVVRFSPELKSEMWSLIAIGPLVVADLRAQPAGYVIATDASSSTGSAVRAKLPSRLCGEFCRYSLSTGTWTRLLPPMQAWLRERECLEPEDELPGSDPLQPNAVAILLATCLPYRERWRRSFSRSTSIGKN